MADTPNPLPPATVPVLDDNNALTLPWRRALQNNGAQAAAGITQLTGDVTAVGPGVATAAITPTGVTPGSYTNADLTIGADGRVTHAEDGTTPTGTTDPLTYAALAVSDGYLTVSAAYKLAHTHSIAATGDADWSVNFNGASDVTAAITVHQAAKWTTARTLSFTGDVTGSGSVDGSASVATALTLAASGVTAATYGDASNVGQFTVDAKGRITSASNVPISGAAGGTVTSVAISSSDSTLTVNSGSPITGAGTIDLSAVKLKTARNIAITGDLAWNVNFDGSAAVTAAGTLATVNSNVGSFTNANITVNAKGLITAAASGSGGTGTVTHTGTLTSGQIIQGNGGADITVGDLSGDISTSGSLVTAIGANKVTNAMLRQSGALAVVGRSANSTGNVADIAASAASDAVLRESGSTIGFGTIATGGIANSAVTLAKIANAAASSKLLGSGASGSGAAYVELTLGTNLSMSGTTLNATGGSGSPGGSSGQIQYNNAGSFGGSDLSGDVTTAGTLAATFAVPLTPGGRLTLTSNTPVMTADATAQGTVYYAPYVHARCPIYTGSVWAMRSFSQLTLTLNSTDNLLENVYDIYMFDNSGTLTLGTGPAWVNTATVTWTSASPGVCSWTAHGLYEGAPVIFTAGTSTPTGITAGTTYYVSKTGLTANAFSVSTSVANASAGTNVNTSSTGTGTQTGTNHTTLTGTGASTTERELKDGIETNKNAITLRAGGSSLGSISANRATLLGSIYCTANGQTGMAFKPAAGNGGTNNILGVSNSYNRVGIKVLCRDAGPADYGYNSATWRGAQGNTSNRISFLDCLQQSFVEAINAASGFTTNGAASRGTIGVNLDSTSLAPGMTAEGGLTASSSTLSVYPLTSSEMFLPQLGFHYIQRMESAITGTFNFQCSGTSPTRQNNSLTVMLEM